MTIAIKNMEYNDDLGGYVVQLENGKIVQIQFEIETNKLHADYGKRYPHIDKQNDYGLNLTEDEEDEFDDWMINNSEIQAQAEELDAKIEEEEIEEQKRLEEYLKYI